MNPRIACMCLLLALGCGRGKAETVPPASAGSASAVVEPPAPEVAARYEAAAAELDPLLVAELAHTEGADVMIDQARRNPAWSRVVVAALPSTGALRAVEYLAELATNGSDEQAEAAVSAGLELAGGAQRNQDLEDAEELRRGCATLMRFVEDEGKPKPRRARSLSLLRALSPFGCSAPAQSELDAR